MSDRAIASLRHDMDGWVGYWHFLGLSLSEVLAVFYIGRTRCGHRRSTIVTVSSLELWGGGGEVAVVGSLFECVSHGEQCSFIERSAH